MKELMVLWDRFFFARVDARPMGLFRIAFGAYLLVFYWQLKWILELYFLKSGFAVHFAAKPAVSFPNGLFVNLANVSPTWFIFSTEPPLRSSRCSRWACGRGLPPCCCGW